MNLTFGEQLLLLLNRKNMTIQEFSELLEARTGVPCPVEHLKQQLKKDNFLEQDMSILAAALDRQVVISLEPISTEEPLEDFSLFSNYRPVDNSIRKKPEELHAAVEDSSLPEIKEDSGPDAQPKEDSEPDIQPISEQDMMIRQVTQSLKEAVQKSPAKSRKAENAASISLPPDSINPYTREEYLNNTVRKHPDQDHYIQVYDISEHKWIDVPENYFQKFQYVKRKIMGKDYTPPIYI